MYLGWFSCGVTSAVACKLAIDMYGSENVDLWYIETGASHPDNGRFIKDCENWYGKEIKIAKSKLPRKSFLIHHMEHLAQNI